jgi:hypothetical protein
MALDTNKIRFPAEGIGSIESVVHLNGQEEN